MNTANWLKARNPPSTPLRTSEKAELSKTQQIKILDEYYIKSETT